jgi:hypothetical protein
VIRHLSFRVRSAASGRRISKPRPQIRRWVSGDTIQSPDPPAAPPINSRVTSPGPSPACGAKGQCRGDAVRQAGGREYTLPTDAAGQYFGGP